MLENVEKSDNIIKYERKKKKMSTAANNQERQNEQQNMQNALPNNASANNHRGFWETVKEFWVIIAAAIGACVYVISSIVSQGKDIEYLKSQVSQTSDNIANISTRVEDIGRTSDENYEIFLELSAANKKEKAQSIVFQDLYRVKTETIQNEEYLAQPNWDEESIIASDIEDNIAYTGDDLQNMLILTSYIENGNEVYFLGRFDEENRWNGKCILNVYNGDKLVSVFEGTYNNGELFTYKRISQGEDSTWVINERKRQGDYNSGETWEYKKTEDFVKGFTLENVEERQILTIDKFLNSIDKELVSYYHGNTSNNLYNDTTGNSYLVKYKDNGDVSLLYVGNMKDGLPHDSTGNAWSIGWGYADDGYHYYKGNFYNNSHKETKESMKVMEKEQIDEIINKDRFNCPLTGLID